MGSLWAGTRVRLRGVEPEDWEAFRRFDEHTDDMRALDRVHPPRSRAGYRQWAADRAVEAPQGDDFRLVIATTADDAAVGMINTVDANPRTGRFEYGIGIGREHQRHGYAREAITILLRFMFTERRYHKCEVSVYAYNTASLALHRGLGFTDEGRLRDHEYGNGAYHDLVLMGMTRAEYVARLGGDG